MSEILAKVFRGETVEAVHRGHLVIVSGEGLIVAKIGDPDAVTFWRSAAKSFQAIPFIGSRAASTFGFTRKELALACASHSGEKIHTDLALGMLEKGGFEESDLQCGVHPSFHGETAEAMIKSGAVPTQVNNNCSGKHAAMLAFAKHIGADPKTYLSQDNPVQKEILRIISLFTEVDPRDISFGTDGCSAPNFALPLLGMARAFVKLVNPPMTFEQDLRTDCKTIVAAQTEYPEYVGGEKRLDTRVMKALNGKIICKVGAEGIWCAGILPNERWKSGLGIALKIEDGDGNRARPVVAIKLLEMLGLLEKASKQALSDYSPIVLKNNRGIVVGEVKPSLEQLQLP